MKFLIINNSSIYKDGLKLNLSKFFSSMKFLEAESYKDAFNILEREKDVNLVLIDSDMPDLEWKEGMNQIMKAAPMTRIAILAGLADKDDIRYAFNAGAVAFIPKNYSIKIMVSTLRLLLDGGTYFPMADNTESNNKENISIAATKSFKTSRSNTLTVKQREVLSNLGEGFSNKQIAHLMNVSEATVKLHMNSLLRALNVTNRTSAVLAAQKRGLLPTK